MMRKLICALCLLAVAGVLFSCGDGNADTTPAPTTPAPTTPAPTTPAPTTPAPTTPAPTTPAPTTPTPVPEPESVVVFSPDIRPRIIVPGSPTNYDSSAGFAFREILSTAIGLRDLPVADSKAEPAGNEIVVGATNRPISSVAMAAIAAYSGDTAAYAIVELDGSLAIVANGTLAMSFGIEHFRTTYLSAGDTLTVPKGLLDVQTFSISAYEEQLRAEEEARRLAEEEKKWNERWDKVETTLDAGTVEALKEMYDFYTTEGDALTWIAKLWDPWMGGFYYANSARDNEGFLPDLESTAQALAFLANNGVFSYFDGSTSHALPADMKARILAFAQNMQSESDGYFYHPQWGTNIGNTRRGRDLGWAISLIQTCGGVPLYPTALDRLSGSTAANVRTVTRLLSGVTLRASASHLASEEAFVAYLEGLNINKDSHSAGHTIASQASQIKAAGLGDVCCDYLDSIQNSENGLWQTEVNYTSLSGLFKISSVYNTVGREIKYADLAMASAIEAIKQTTDPSIIIYVYNPWNALQQVISNAKKYGSTDTEAVIETVRAGAPEMIRLTVEKLRLFRKTDGSFSYYQDKSAPTTQGTSVSLGLNEGDVNATTLGHTIGRVIFSCLGVSSVPYYGHHDYARLMEIIENAKPIEKELIDFAGDGHEDFESDSNYTRYNSSTEVTSTVVDPADSSNKVLSIESKRTENTAGVVIESSLLSHRGDATEFTVSFRFYVPSRGTNSYLNDYFTTEGNSNMYQLRVVTGGNILSLFNIAAYCGGSASPFGNRNGSETVTGVCISFVSTTSNSDLHRFENAILALDTWHTVSLTFRCADMASYSCAVQVDGQELGSTSVFYLTNGELAPLSSESLAFRVTTLMRTRGTLYVDDIMYSDENTDRSDEP